ncbi:fungal-specific transcription factor domain-containing protein [Exophiala viscosa]|uniref:Fungal-specific transcription factor domain-containing protein n=1 Tax=Exophiala viscosa TaxID=2486360 RepID=A0AAN6E5C5_9EURO|nr:fungal-specific transcription factor domain-containing protein [Exophiala viscosa]
MDAELLQLLNYWGHAPRKPLPQWACLECRRYGHSTLSPEEADIICAGRRPNRRSFHPICTTGDMKRPTCSLCSRIEMHCVYPTMRRVNRGRRKGATVRSETGVQHGTPGSAESDRLSAPQVQSAPTSAPVDSNGILPIDFGVGRLENSALDVYEVNHSNSSGTPNFVNDFFIFPFLPAGHNTDFGPQEYGWFDEPAPFHDGITTRDHAYQPNPFRIDENSLSHNSRATAETSTHHTTGTSRLECAPAMADHLIELFFKTIQGFLPLLHRPNIYAKFLNSRNGHERVHDQISIPDAILLNSMFALCARFSEWHQCWETEPKLRGIPFAQKAKALWREHVKEEEEEEPSMRLLQSRILLTYYELTSGPSFQAWQSAGLCCRMAYSLSLHRTDRQTSTTTGSGGMHGLTWVQQEERRRAWWAVFQIDNVASTTSCRPYNIDSSNMDVFLPVSDDAWFSGYRSQLSPDLPESLQSCENQDSYAWFMVVNELLRASQRIFDRKHHTSEELKLVQSSLHCFALALPSNFRLTASNMTFNDDNFVEKNWVINTIVLLQAAQIFIALTLEIETLQEVPTKLTSEDLRTRLFDFCNPHINDQLRALRLWSPDYIALGSPILTCALLGPAAIHAMKRPNEAVPAGQRALCFLEGEILSFVLQRFSEYWPLGTVTHEMLKNVQPSSVNQRNPHEKMGTTWVQCMTPSLLANVV